MPLFTDGSILASASAAQELKKEQGLIVSFNRNIDFEVNGHFTLPRTSAWYCIQRACDSHAK